MFWLGMLAGIVLVVVVGLIAGWTHKPVDFL